MSGVYVTAKLLLGDGVPIVAVLSVWEQNTVRVCRVVKLVAKWKTRLNLYRFDRFFSFEENVY